jgi:Pyridoxamine 5'-phosphate oxidase
MGKTYDYLTPELVAWLMAQKMFCVATAPLAAEGHVNCSPKGRDTLRVLGEHEVAYLDLTGSGIETIAHLQENGRIVLMFCAFSGPPKIVRLHGRGRVIYPGDAEFERLGPQFPSLPGARAIVHVAVERISDSCGYGVPLMDFVSQRDAIKKWAEKKGPDGVAAYHAEKNHVSIDALPGYQAG